MKIVKNNTEINLWDKDTEMLFFKDALNFASIDQLFYKTDDKRFLAFWLKGYRGKKSTLQSRNSLIGNYTEKWTRDLIQKSVDDLGLYVIQGAVCDELGLSNRSPADVVISDFEERFWNWELVKINGNHKIDCVGDYSTHTGTPSLLRSDSMLKAIGKSIGIRVSSLKSSSIPIIIVVILLLLITMLKNRSS
jgi:hypothetical protein